MTGRSIVSGVSAIAAVIAVVAAFLLRKPEIGPIEAPKATTFNLDLVTRGAEIAAIGNCVVCHTKQNGAAYAGSRALPTPFGTVYSSNISPDQETGIGRWSEEAFRRALRDGVDRIGRHLYPAFPYDHFTHLTDYDIHALYAFMMTRDPVRAVIPENKLSFPFNIRPLLAGWNLLFLRGDREAKMHRKALNGIGVLTSPRVQHTVVLVTHHGISSALKRSRKHTAGPLLRDGLRPLSIRARQRLSLGRPISFLNTCALVGRYGMAERLDRWRP